MNKMEYTFTLDKLIEVLKDVQVENGKKWLDSTAAIGYVAKLTGFTYDEVYKMVSKRRNDYAKPVF